MGIGDRIRALRTNTGMTQVELANKLNISNSTLSQYESGARTPSDDMKLKIAALFQVSTDYLLSGAVNTVNTKVKGVQIPVLGDVRAGYPMEAVENIIDYEEIDEETARRGEFFALRIKGDSMEPRFVEGDVVIVRKQETADSGDIVVALVNGDSATIKKLKRHQNGITLMPTNPTYEPMYYSNEEIMELPVTILGKVVELRAKF
ncbi:LexA family protein [Butyricicoccus pullicaecorum]|uniref:Repressor LexA n=1 Tax=Butyricicoccus pullicaecorum 1.2 TaxID=1203606 RepID=R8VZ60_9FIRM|nr:LexA family transcriptional regulator [Butyricicoccus pullicaecorum]EOQ37970.1 repressor LexA [Butyricicoccus pullicaecorum 1.2]SKA60759.1 repressor LexA [Butyricicoccus pullicaecorum DSM 23266]